MFITNRYMGIIFTLIVFTMLTMLTMHNYVKKTKLTDGFKTIPFEKKVCFKISDERFLKVMKEVLHKFQKLKIKILFVLTL